MQQQLGDICVYNNTSFPAAAGAVANLHLWWMNENNTPCASLQASGKCYTLLLCWLWRCKAICRQTAYHCPCDRVFRRVVNCKKAQLHPARMRCINHAKSSFRAVFWKLPECFNRKTQSGKPQRGKNREERDKRANFLLKLKEQQRAEDLSESNGFLHLLKGNYTI